MVNLGAARFGILVGVADRDFTDDTLTKKKGVSNFEKSSKLKLKILPIVGLQSTTRLKLPQQKKKVQEDPKVVPIMS